MPRLAPALWPPYPRRNPSAGTPSAGTPSGETPWQVRPGPRQRGFEALRDGGAQFALAPGMVLGELFELGDDRLRIDQVAAGAVRALRVQHVIGLAEQARGVIVIAGGRARRPA